MVNASPEKAYTYFRNLENLPCFTRHVKSIELLGDNRSHWVVAGPAGTQVEWDSEIINDIPNRLIAWRSVHSPDIDTAGSIHFDPIGEDGGSRIRVSLQYLPPAGALGVAVAKLFGEEPEQQLQDDLSRLKLVLENTESPFTSEPTQDQVSAPDQSRSAAAGSL